MNDAARAEPLPTSFGAFKPTGHVMVGIPSLEQAGSLTGALRAAGWAEEAVTPFTPRENVANTSNNFLTMAGSRNSPRQLAAAWRT